MAKIQIKSEKLTPERPPLFRWRAHAHLLYENWLNYYVYQNTPYDLGEIQRVKHGK